MSSKTRAVRENVLLFLPVGLNRTTFAPDFKDNAARLRRQMYNLKRKEEMKKIVMTMAAALVAVSMSAQVYVGGSLGIGSVKNGNADAETVFKIIPEIGYNVSDELAFGVALGYEKGNCDLMTENNFSANKDTKVFQVSPYVRYTFLNTNLVNVFVDGGVDFKSYKDQGTGLNFGLKPGVALKMSEKLSFVTHVGFVGYKSFNPKGDGDTSNKVGVDLNGTNINFGLYYNF